MAHRLSTCDPGRLEQLLRDRLPDDARRELEAHLYLCPQCRERLDELAGGKRWWSEVRRFLGGDGASQSLPTMDHPPPRRWSDLDLDFLTPSDYPGALGRLGGYEVLEILGRGGWGVVLKAFDTSLHRPVAIKVLAEGYAANGTARKRFAREARAAAAVVHDHVVPVHAVDSEATPPYLVMAFIPGQSLQQRIDRSGPLDLKEVLRIGSQTASGLAAAHAQGLVHRDIKPANIMLENGVERVVLTDFGLARSVDDASVTGSGAVAGTPQYMAPEQARGEAVDQRADLFALGSTLYAMCTGQAPFRGESSMAVIRQVCDVEPQPIRGIDPEVPAWLEGIVKKLHAKDPTERLQSATEVADLLERCLAHVQHPDRYPLPALAAELGRRVSHTRTDRPRPHRWAASVAALVLALLSGTVLSSLAWPLRQSDDDGSKNAGVEQDPASIRAEVVASDFEGSGDLRKLRSDLEHLRRSLAEVSADEWGAESTRFADAARKVDRLQRSLSADGDTDDDPVSGKIVELRRRLESVRHQLGVPPE
jgi:serine/threonine-protein kinase